MKIEPTDALIVVDLQKDFCKGGALAVPGADEIVGPINQIMPLFPFVVTTQDWHPENHSSFEAQDGSWPAHCVQNTEGAQLHPALNHQEIDLKIFKATSPVRDAYSGFQGTHLAQELKSRQVQRVFIAGLATDYCVKHTALDAITNGFTVIVIADLVRAVNIQTGDGEKSLQEIRSVGGQLIQSTDLTG